ncbi:MAG: hypothetical protein GY778_26695 [bacterium]|nr:hypothetical protein [bacterium]
MNATIEQDTTRLLKILNGRKVSPNVLETDVPAFTAESKNEAVQRVAKEPAHKQSGQLLARLPLIETPQNKAGMTAIFEENLDAPEPAARRSSLYGLEKLEHPRLKELAIPLLEDDDDTVLYAACHVILPHAPGDRELWEKLQRAYRARKGDERFHMSTSLLEAHEIGRTSPKQRRLGEDHGN